MQFVQCCDAAKLLLKNWNEAYFGREQIGKEDAYVYLHYPPDPRVEGYNRSLNELSRLGDRELADIGISRCDIPRVAWNAAHER